MLKKILIKNYKSLVMHDSIDIGRLTIIAGKNNVGKSATLQAILDMTKYTDGNSLDTIDLSYEPLLANFYRKVNNNILDNIITNILEIQIENEIYILEYEFSYDEKSKSGFISTFKFKSALGEETPYLEMTKQNLKSRYRIKANKILTPMFVKVKDGVEDLPEYFEGEGSVMFMGFVPMHTTFKFKDNPVLHQWFEQDEDEDEIIFSLGFARKIVAYYTSVKYIGPLRSLPKEYYLLDKRSSLISSNGEETIDVLDLLKNEEVTYYSSLEDTEVTKKTLLEAVQYWISYFTNVDFELQEVRNNLLQVLVNGHPMNHSGFGISQLLPIIVQALLIPKGGIIFLEQPEIHLHPELEMKLAEFLLCIIKNNRQIIAETHSEHIVNQLTLLKMDYPEIDEFIKIYFYEKDNTEVKIEKIIIDERGSVVNWPEGFFDQYLKFSNALMSRRAERAKKIQQQKVK